MRTEEKEKRRKAGKIVPPRLDQAETSCQAEESTVEVMQIIAPPPVPPAPEEDIFGARPSKVVIHNEDADRIVFLATEGEAFSTGRTKRDSMPQQILDNKAVRTCLFLFRQGYTHEHL